LEAIKLHDSLHGCCNKRGTGTTFIEAKLAQQLSYLERKPFYGVFLDLQKAFNAMDWERCIMLLEGYGAGPWMIRLIRGYWRDVSGSGKLWHGLQSLLRCDQGRATFCQIIQHSGQCRCLGMDLTIVGG
jgi:hypothetical protein